MEEKLNKLISYCRQVDNVYLKNELKEVKKEVLRFSLLRIEAMEKRITELEEENECLKAKLEVYGQN
jgi:uncharacterized small protein (DUF1192 family)